MCFLRYFWNREKKKDSEECGGRHCNLISTYLNYVTHQCCMKTLALLVIGVVLFCVLGNPSRNANVPNSPSDRTFDWFNLFTTIEEESNTIKFALNTKDVLLLETEDTFETSERYQPEANRLNCICDSRDVLPSRPHLSGPNSTCDLYATLRGPNQRVASYSFYGDWKNNPEVARKFFNQIGARAEEVKTFYPGWLMRLYFLVNDEEGREELCQLWCKYDHLDLCDVTDLPQPIGNLDQLQPVGRTWRFAVMSDPLVDAFISRDLDSAILKREVSAVESWLQRDDRTFHIMRDHPSHNGYMMAGLWGAKNSADRPLLAELGSMLFHSKPRKYWDFDQALLRRIVWPEAVKSSLQHDSYSCTYQKFNQFHPVEPFPERRVGLAYAGWGPVKTSENRTGITTCPIKCRPVNHLDWITC